MSQNVTWDFAGTTVDAVDPDNSPSFADVTPGTERTWRLSFYHDAGTTVGDATVGTTTIGASPATRHQSVLDYVTAAEQGVYAVATEFTGEPWYHEQVPAGASVSTLVAKFAPNGAIGRHDRWALVTGGSDASPGQNDLPRRIDIDLVDLAHAGTYADLSAVQTALEADTA